MSDSLQIERLTNRYRVPEQVGQPLPVPLIIEQLSTACEALWSGREGVWLIKKLQVRAAIAGEWSSDQSARSLATGIAQELCRTLEAGPNYDDVVYFESRAEYLSRFLVDCAAGRAVSDWKYREFDRWSGLSTSRALSEAILSEPETALSALAGLIPLELDAVLRQLSSQDSDAIAASIFGQRDFTSSDSDSLVGAYQFLSMAGRLVTNTSHLNLLLGVESFRITGKAPDLRLVRAVATLALALANIDRARLEDGARLLASGDTSAFIQRFISIAPASVAALDALGDLERDRLVGQLARALSRRETSTADALITNFGGAFLLAPFLEEFEWQTEGWPKCGSTDARDVVQWLTLVTSMGSSRGTSALDDPWMRYACGIHPDVTRAALATWSRRISRGQIRAFRQAWVESLLARRKVELKIVRVARAGRCYVASDDFRGIWLSISSRLIQQPAQLRLPAENDSMPDIRHNDPDPKIKADLLYLTPALGIASGLKRLLAEGAQSLVREFAWRLPGFSKSTIGYLAKNFLDIRARISKADEHILVQLEAPPLQFVLAQSGMNRKTFNLPATGDLPWILTDTR